MVNHVELCSPAVNRRFTNSTLINRENPAVPGSPVMMIECMPLSGTAGRGDAG